MISPIIRPMELADIDAVLVVENQSFSVPWSREAFEAEVCDNDLAYYLVLIIDNKIVGYGGLWIVLDEAHITNIAIRADFRGRGLGKILLDEMIGLSKGKGASSMTLEVRVSNDPAKRLYESCGFRTAGVRRQYYSDNNEDALIMWLSK